jgi:predicted RNase H-like HicB family nuclease
MIITSLRFCLSLLNLPANYEETYAFALIAEVPDLPGCAADGATYQAALQNVEVIMQEWIETAQELKRPIPQHKARLMSA